jgi:hypothetical protein
MVDLLDVALFVPGVCFLAIALYGIKRGKVAPPLPIAIAKNYDWGQTDSKDKDGYWTSIVIYLIIAFVLFSVAIANLFLSD